MNAKAIRPVCACAPIKPWSLWRTWYPHVRERKPLPVNSRKLSRRWHSVRMDGNYLAGEFDHGRYHQRTYRPGECQELYRGTRSGVKIIIRRGRSEGRSTQPGKQTDLCARAPDGNVRSFYRTLQCGHKRAFD